MPNENNKSLISVEGNALANINIDGKPFKKLLDSIGGAIRAWWSPGFTKKMADADAYSKIISAQADAQVALIQASSYLQVHPMTVKKVLAEQEIKMLNTSAILDAALQHLNKEVSDQPIDQEWRTRFFSKAEDISTDELQQVWAKILANEINKPGSVSLRTLDILSNVSKSEGELFLILASITTIEGSVIKISGNALDKYGLSHNDLMNLKESGLLSESTMIVQTREATSTLSTNKLEHGVVISFSDIGCFVYKANTPQMRFEVLLLTKAGTELFSIISPEVNFQYLSDLKFKLTQEQFKFAWFIPDQLKQQNFRRIVGEVTRLYNEQHPESIN